MALSRTILYGFLVPCQNLEKTNYAIPRKRSGRRKERRTDVTKDGQTLFHRTPPATAGSPKILSETLILAYFVCTDYRNTYTFTRENISLISTT